MNGLTPEETKQLQTLISKANRHDLRNMARIFKARHSALETMQTAAIQKGSRVEFTGKYGRVTGTVTKINRKTVAVKSDDDVNWRVSGSLLKELIE